MNFWDILILLSVACAVVLALRRIHIRKQAGKGCCGSCEGCNLCKSKNRAE